MSSVVKLNLPMMNFLSEDESLTFFILICAILLNSRLKHKLKELADQYTLSEQQYNQKVSQSCKYLIKLFSWDFLFSPFPLAFVNLNSLCVLTSQLKQKTLELQIADLKLKQHEEKLIQEQSQMKLYAEQVSQLLATEKNLRLQLTADGEKFQQFQVTE